MRYVEYLLTARSEITFKPWTIRWRATLFISHFWCSCEFRMMNTTKASRGAHLRSPQSLSVKTSSGRCTTLQAYLLSAWRTLCVSDTCHAGVVIVCFLSYWSNKKHQLNGVVKALFCWSTNDRPSEPCQELVQSISQPLLFAMTCSTKRFALKSWQVWCCAVWNKPWVNSMELFGISPG